MPAQVLETPVISDENSTINLHFCSQQLEAKQAALARAADGQLVLWIENTVDNAQGCYLDLASQAREAGCEIGLLHSRMTVSDRAAAEDHWVTSFGRAGWPSRRQQGRILIGTQVLEQSLDIDADFLITRFAPSDMLLQRLGRLWRHPDAPRHAKAKPDCWLLAPSLAAGLADPPSAFAGSAWVYPPYLVFRSLEVWQSLSRISLPQDIRPIIDATYVERQEHDNWAALLHQLKHGNRYRKGQQALQAFAQLTLAQQGQTLDDQAAPTRYSFQESEGILLVRSLSLQNQQTRITLLNGQTLTLPHRRSALSHAEWRQLAREINSELVRCPVRYCPKPQSLQE